jgi:hypothetical protein
MGVSSRPIRVDGYRTPRTGFTLSALARRPPSARTAETGMSVPRVAVRMCKYCNWAFHDGWGELLKYDDVYQSAVGAETESTHGFHEDWDDLQAELGI